jgi:hypothetical protein
VSARQHPDAAPAQPAPQSLARLAAIGFAAGLFSGIFGVGGGAVAVPLLVLWVGFSEREASATSLALIVVVAAVGAASQAAHDLVHVGDAALVGIPAVGGVLLGTRLQQRVEGPVIAVCFALVATAAAIELVLQ